MHGIVAGLLTESEAGASYTFSYASHYQGPPISLTMPLSRSDYAFAKFPPFFDGLLPEGPQLEALLRLAKLDRSDLMGQLITVGADMVGAVTVESM